MKRAVLIGIDEYTYFNALKGCENDVRGMAELLKEQFAFDDVQLLVNTDATRDNILSAFDRLVAATQRDDIAVIYYAGHGSQIRDREGDEPSGFDSTLIPVDSARDDAHPEMMREITDDEIFLFLQKLGNKTSAITVIVDACHSGTITRDASSPEGLGLVRGVPADTRALTTPSPIPAELWPLLRGDAGASSGGWLPVRDHYVTLSGCRDEELSGELSLKYDDGRTINHGALTYYLTQALRDAGPGSTYRSVFESVAPNVTAFRQGKQHPQMEGMIDRELFGMKEIPPMRYVRVANVSADGNTITLAAGAALGFTAGTVVALYQAGTVNTEGQTPLALAEVTSVGAVESTATVRAEGRTGAITESSRAVVQTFGLTDSRRTVQLVATENEAVSAAAIGAMRAAIEASTLLRLVNEPTIDTLTVRVWPAANAQSAPRWAITGVDATPVAPLKTIDDVQAVLINLNVLARQGMALALANVNANSTLARVKPKLELLYRYDQNEYQVAVPGPSGLPEFNEDVFIGVRITNTHTAPVYISLLDFGLSGKVTPMYPPTGAQEALAAGTSVDLLVRKGERWRFALPSVYPFVADGPLPVRDDGIETIKLFATTAPASFEFLKETVGVRSAAAPSRTQREFIERVSGTRDGAAFVEEPDPLVDDWTTVLAPFLLRRKNTPAIPASVARLLASEGCVLQQSIPSAVAGAASDAVVSAPAPAVGFGQLLLSMTADGSVLWQLPDEIAADAPIQRYTPRMTPSGTAIHARAVFTFALDAKGAMPKQLATALGALQLGSTQARMAQAPSPSPSPIPLTSAAGTS